MARISRHDCESGIFDANAASSRYSTFHSHYRFLGLELMDHQGDPACPGWARMHSEGGDLIFLLAETPLEEEKSPFFLYLYTDELAALRKHLLANGVKVSEIHQPPCMQSGEISVPDPDGHCVLSGSGVRLNMKGGNGNAVNGWRNLICLPDLFPVSNLRNLSAAILASHNSPKPLV